MNHLRFPIGKFQAPTTIDQNQIRTWIQTIKDFPKQVQNEIEGLSEQDFEKQYRPDGWTITQVINHCADSHMNSLIRFKLALTENHPTIKPYFENLWAELADSKHFPVSSSLKILEGLHERWVFILENMAASDLEKTFIHPETNEKISLKTNIGIYAWHCEHHLSHIKLAKQN